MVDPQYAFVSRVDLAKVFPDPRMIDAYEQLQKLTLTTTPVAVNEAQTAADLGISLANDAQLTANNAQTAADTAQAAADKGIGDAAAVQANLTTLETNELALAIDPFAAIPAYLPNARKLLGQTVGVKIDRSIANEATIQVDALAILNTKAVDLTQPVKTTSTLDVGGLTTITSNLVVSGSVTTDFIVYGQTATAGVVVATHTTPITVNGVTYKLLLST